MNSVWYVTTLGGESWHSQNTDEPSVAINVNAWPLCRLGELCSRQRVSAVADNQVPLVRPADVDRSSGAQMPHEYADLQPVMMLGRELAHGDILVPRNPAIPAILVGPSHAQCAFSTAFIAIRAQHERMRGEYLWMLLCSTRGMKARAALSEHHFEFESLERLEVAVPPLEKQRTRSIHAPGVHWVSAESSWQVGDLSQVRSWTFGTSLVDGETIMLGDLVDVKNGSVDDNELFAVTAKGRVPVLTSVPSIQEGPEFWGYAREDQVSDGAWIAISPQYPFSSAIVPRGWAVARPVLVLRAPPSRAGELTSEQLATWLGSFAGRTALRGVAAGTVLPRLTVPALRGVRAPKLTVVFESPQDSLAQRAERVLELL